MKIMNILDLNVDCLLHIFSYCEEKDLLNLCLANYQLQKCINDYIFFTRTLDLLMCGHRNGPSIQKRTHQQLSYMNRLSISRNWLKGCYYQSEYFPHKQMFPSKLHLERNWLFCTYANYLRQHKRLGYREPLERSYYREICSSSKADIADFVKKDETIFAARVYGNCFIYENNYVTEQQLHSTKDYMYCVDFASDMYVTASDKCSRLWRREEEFGLIHLERVRSWDKSYKAFKFTDDARHLFGGLYTDVNHAALRLLDVERDFEIKLNSKTLSIYDLKLKDENTIFTANFDTTFRMHDKRANADVSIWEDPFDSSFYCLEHDGLYAVLCGTKYHSRVNLYDIRVPKKYIQLYFPSHHNRRFDNSPVYSIACDSRYLFVATDRNLRVLDYKADSAASIDYRNIFSETRRYKKI